MYCSPIPRPLRNECALSWLEHPADFVWVQFEAEEYGYLDEVVILKSDQTLSLIQIKHVTERPDRPGLSLEDLLQKKTARTLYRKRVGRWIFAVRRGSGASRPNNWAPAVSRSKLGRCGIVAYIRVQFSGLSFCSSLKVAQIGKITVVKVR
jgi:hypothetical protein